MTAMELNPLVSIIMPCLNADRTLEESIRSVISQSYRNIELIVIDDGSADSSLDIVRKFSSLDARIHLIINRADHGVSHARNLGIDIAQGKYMCFLDSDDYLTDNSIQMRVEFAEAHGVDVVYGSYFRLHPDGDFSLIVPPKRISYIDMLRKNYIGNLTGFYNINSVGKFFQKNVRHEDYLMWLLILRKVNFAYSVGPESLGYYRVSSASLSGNKLKAFWWHWLILRDELNLPFVKSVYLQLFYFFSSIFNRLFPGMK